MNVAEGEKREQGGRKGPRGEGGQGGCGGQGRPTGFRIPLAREGYPFMAIALVIDVILFWATRSWPIGIVFFGLFIFVVAFFRDPERKVPEDPSAIVSPADGRVIIVERVRENRFTNGEAMKISIFMSLFNVHVNRVPASGRVEKIQYNPGKFFSANLDKASLENEQNAVIARGEGGEVFVFNQIAGLVARRIVCRLKEGMVITRGRRFGLIRFGSRLDVYLPPGSRVAVRIGDRVSAGTSILGYWT